MNRTMRSLLRDKSGTSALEYTVLAALIALGMVGIITSTNVNGAIASVFSAFNASLPR
ncbi:MAG: Flp family type IVb pilin [Bacteroidota bacterium]